jgi:hypothetical protein
MLFNFHPNGFGEKDRVDGPITKDTMKQIYVNED